MRAPENLRKVWAKRNALRVWTEKCPANLSLKAFSGLNSSQLLWLLLLLSHHVLSFISFPFESTQSWTRAPRHGAHVCALQEIRELGLSRFWAGYWGVAVVFSPASLILSSSPPLSFSLNTSVTSSNIYFKYIFDFLRLLKPQNWLESLGMFVCLKTNIPPPPFPAPLPLSLPIQIIANISFLSIYFISRKFGPFWSSGWVWAAVWPVAQPCPHPFSPFYPFWRCWRATRWIGKDLIGEY